MSEFAKKYDIREETVELLIRDGWVTCSLPMYEKVIVHYRNSKSMQKTADELGLSKRHVHTIVHRLK